MRFEVLIAGKMLMSVLSVVMPSGLVHRYQNFEKHTVFVITVFLSPEDGNSMFL
jgi:hypothetical protein